MRDGSVGSASGRGAGGLAAASTVPLSDYGPRSMRAVCQRVTGARVRVGDEVVGEIGPGLCVLLGVARDDGEEAAVRLAAKGARLRIFADDEGRFDPSLVDVRGSALVVSQVP